MKAWGKAFTFVDQPGQFREPMAFVSVIPRDISSKKDLLQRLFEILQLPGYFGFNWDALNDCLCDFHWIKQTRIVILHEDLPKLDDQELRTYLDILMGAILHWRSGMGHSLEVVFPKDALSRVSAILA